MGAAGKNYAANGTAVTKIVAYKMQRCQRENSGIFGPRLSLFTKLSEGPVLG